MRWTLLGSIGGSLALLGARAELDRRLLAAHGAMAPVIATIALFALYGGLVYFATRGASASVRIGFQCGVLAAFVDIAGIAAENLARLDAPWSAVFALGAMGATFALWAAAGMLAARGARGAVAGALAGGWSAMVTATLAVSFGFALEFFLAPPKPDYVATWGEFQRSGWTDPRAFAFVNTIESALTHMMLGPAIGAILGAAAAWFAGVARARRSAL
jgi:hypothetical protein